MVTGQQIVGEAREWIGTPFVHGQALKHVGCDCIGLITGVAAQLQLPEAFAWNQDRRYRGYGPLPQPALLLEACANYLDSVKADGERVGDVLLMTFLREPMHFGFLASLEPFYLIHGYQMAGGVVEHGINGKWRRRIRGAFRLRGAG